MVRYRDGQRHARRLFCALVCALLVFTTTAHAAPLSLAEALERVLIDSPQLAAYPFSLRAAEARTLQAGLRPNPVIELEVENVAGSGDFTRTDATDVTLALSQLIELGDKRQHRRAVAEWEQRGQGVAYELARLEVLGETARRYVETARAQLMAELGQQQLAVAQRALSAANARVEAGAAPVAEAKRLSIALTRAKLDAQRAEGEWQIARTRLATLWGGTPGVEAVKADALASFPVLPAEAVLMESLESTPTLQRLATTERLRQAQLRLAESRAVPDIEVGAGVRHIRESSDNALVFSFSMPLQLFDRNQGGIAVAAAELAATGREQHAARIELRILLRTLYRQLALHRAEAELLRSTALPTAREVLEEIERGYRGGRYSVLELIAAQAERLALEAEAIAAEAAFHLQLIELERLTGQPMTPASSVTVSVVEDSL
jgi:cobalt-zinc-cadmium efflux system outer membrane protein